MNKLAIIILLSIITINGCALKNKSNLTVTKYYYRTGELMGVSYFDGYLRQGPTTTYYKDGTIREELSYEENERHGTRRVYYENGKLHCEETYDKGFLLSRKEYDREGNIIKEEEFKRETLAE